MKELLKGLNEASKKINEANVAKGFYETPRETGTLLMLMVSELAEALEADRKNRFADMFLFDTASTNYDENFKSYFEEYVKDSFEDEIADTVIRILDLCGYMSIDIERHIDLKLKYNSIRAHKHGKSY